MYPRMFEAMNQGIVANDESLPFVMMPKDMEVLAYMETFPYEHGNSIEASQPWLLQLNWSAGPNAVPHPGCYKAT